MLHVEIPTDDLAKVAEVSQLMAALKEGEISTVHEWKIPCGPGIRLTLTIEGPIGLRPEPRYFDQAVRLLEVAREGVEGWPGDTNITIGKRPAARCAQADDP